MVSMFCCCLHRRRPSSCSTLIRLSPVTRFMPADRISCGPLRHSTVSLLYGVITTQVSSASSPTCTSDGPPVPVKGKRKRKKYVNECANCANTLRPTESEAASD
uniref:Uncharacterized protein n=1 Tax=Anopheles melas TaxID=34690 RepID=A0A182U8U9_9DIPT